jgi:hypothetical protein
MQRLADVGRFKVRVITQDLGFAHAVGDHPDDGGDRQAQPPNARHATHHIGIDGDT